MLRRLLLCTCLVFVVAPATALAQDEGTGSDNLRLVSTLPYEAADGRPNYGTDIEFAKLRGRQYAFAGTYDNGMQIVDIQDPERARIVSVYPCDVLQGDVQIFKRGSRTLATYAVDAFGNEESQCYREAAALGFDVLQPGRNTPGTRGRQGSFIVDVTDPRRPRTVSFVAVAQGTHNQTVDPSGRYLYNSNADLITSPAPAIEIYDIRDLRAPRLVSELALPTRPGLGTESHDITFSDDGDRAYSAALSQGVIIDTRDPAKPSVISSFLDPAINVWHQSDPFTLTDATGRERDFLIVEDEFAGAAGGPVCPSGGVHVYEITGDMESNPVKVGYWNIDDVRPTSDPTGTCTAHVFDIHEDEQIMTMAFYNGGVRVVDLSGLTGVSLGGTSIAGEGMKEIAFYRTPNADTWSVKTPQIDRRTGNFYMYGNDIARGLDIYEFRGAARESRNEGRWMNPAQALRFVTAQRRATPVAQRDPQLFCLLPGGRR